MGDDSTTEDGCYISIWQFERSFLSFLWPPSRLGHISLQAILYSSFDSCFVNSHLARWSTRPQHKEPGSRRSLSGCLFLVWFSLPCKYYTEHVSEWDLAVLKITRFVGCTVLCWHKLTSIINVSVEILFSSSYWQVSPCLVNRVWC